MTIFTFIILIAFAGAFVGQLGAAIERNRLGLAGLFAFEVVAFAYLAVVWA